MSLGFAGTMRDVLDLQGCLCQAECCHMGKLIDFSASGFKVEAGQWNAKKNNGDQFQSTDI